MAWVVYSSSSITIASLFIILALSFPNESYAGNVTPNFESIYSLGDSLSDNGNLVRTPPIGPLLPAARPPYGQTFGRPTGRWSDGLLILDYFARAVGLPLLNPSLDLAANFSNGANFGVAGSTALDSQFFTSRGIIVPPIANLPVQVKWFKDYLNSSICSSPPECSTKLGRSVVWVGEIGGNDINYAAVQGRSIDELRTYIPFIIQAIINNTREVIQLGVTSVVIPGNFPIGCLPVYLNLVSKARTQEFDRFGCSKSYNDLAIYQNNYLKIALASLRQEFPNVKVAYADYYWAFRSVLSRALFLGFDTWTLLKACCGIGGKYNYNSLATCGSPAVPVCRNPNRYINWDGIHLTQEAYRRISEVLNPSIFAQVS